MHSLAFSPAGSDDDSDSSQCSQDSLIDAAWALGADPEVIFGFVTGDGQESQSKQLCDGSPTSELRPGLVPREAIAPATALAVQHVDLIAANTASDFEESCRGLPATAMMTPSKSKRKWDISSSEDECEKDNITPAKKSTAQQRPQAQGLASCPQQPHRITRPQLGEAFSRTVPLPLQGCAWWQDRLLEALAPVRSQVPAKPARQYTCMHLCLGAGTDLLGYEAPV